MQPDKCSRIFADFRTKCASIPQIFVLDTVPLQKKPMEVYTLPLISDEKATHFLYYLIIQRGVSLHEFSCNFSINIRYLAIIRKSYTINIALI